MAKYSLNELKLEIAEILDEAKKKASKSKEIKKRGASVEAYGIYDEAFDFSAPLGDFNLYKQQGGVNFGPYTSAGVKLDNNYSHPNTGPTKMKESDERALRSVVREVIQNGLVPSTSAWAPLIEKREQVTDGGAWGAANNLFEAWYDDFKKKGKNEDEPKKSKKETDYGPVKKHGFEKKKGK
jgi:hypothetical protein